MHVDSQRRRVGEVIPEAVNVGGVLFHREAAPEWHGCHCNHLFSRRFLERLSARLERYALYDALELPFAGTALEIIWGAMPQWLGVEKWFCNGWHRVMKNFATYRREDDPSGVASYVNRYVGGQVAVDSQGDWLQVRAIGRAHRHNLEAMLPACYFNQATPSLLRGGAGACPEREDPHRAEGPGGAAPRQDPVPVMQD